MRNPLEASNENRRRCFCMNSIDKYRMFNILSLYKFSAFADLKSCFVCSNFVLLWTFRIACFCWLRSFSDSLDEHYPKLS